MPRWPIRAGAAAWTSRPFAISMRSPRAASRRTSPCSSTSTPPRACRVSAAAPSTPSRRWTWHSTGACARAISRSRAPRRTACGCWTRRGTPPSCTPTSRARSRSGWSDGGPAVGLESIRGHEEAVALLRRAIETDRVAHAYAFIGPEGVGRKATALAFAEALVGAAGAGRIALGAHPDVRVIEPTPPQSNPKGTEAIRVENIRELGRLASLRPAEAPWKIFIVDQAETMTGAAPQAFLKTLEEPPARTVIILILEQLRALPATVLSRCQIVRFRPVVPEGAVALLPGGDGPERERALKWLGQAQSRDAGAALQVGEAIGRDREAAEAMVETCWLWYRDLLCAQGGADARISVFGGRANASGRTLDEVVAGLRACREAWQAIQGNVSPRLSVEVLLSRLQEVRAAGRRGAGAPQSEASEIHR